MGRPAVRIPEDEVMTLRNLFDEGWSVEEISRASGFDRRVVRRNLTPEQLQALQDEFGKAGHLRTANGKQIMLTAMQRHSTLSKVAVDLGVSRTTLYRLLKLHNLFSSQGT